MNLETRVKNLENLVNSLSKKIDNNKYYTDADLNGTRQSISNITPYKQTKTAYIGDTEVIFNGVIDGNMTVYVKDSNGGYPNYTVERNADIVTVYFEPLEYITDVTISIQ